MKNKSFAKLNLMLNVVGRNEDGYHELEMVTVPIDLFDTLDVNISDQTYMTSNKRYIPNDRRNTVIDAIELMREKYHFKENFTIKLVKNTPTRGGMGGGSSNAATIIKMVDEMLDLKMSLKDMMEIAEKVGSDVPLTLYGKPALVKGIGEKISPITINIDFHILIIKPAKGVSTPQLFKHLDLDNLKHYDPSVVIKALEEGDYDLFVKSLGNSLQDAAVEVVPAIKEATEDLLAFGFDAAVMSGAGSSVFGITQDEELVRAGVQHFYNKYAFIKKSKIIENVRNEEKLR